MHRVATALAVAAVAPSLLASLLVSPHSHSPPLAMSSFASLHSTPASTVGSRVCSASYATPSSARVLRSSAAAAVSGGVSPSLSSLAAIRAQLQQLNQRIKADSPTSASHSATATATAATAASAAATPSSAHALVRALSVSPFTPLTPATPPYTLSATASLDTTLPLAHSGSFSSSPLLLLAPSSSFDATPHTAQHSHAAGGGKHAADSTEAAGDVASCAPLPSSSLPRHCHDIYQLASHSPAAHSPLPLASPPTPSSSSSSSSPLRWRSEAREAQRSSKLYAAHCVSLQAELRDERLQRAASERRAGDERRRWQQREAEDVAGRAERERAMDDMRRDIDSTRRAMAEGRTQLEAQLRAEYEEVVAAQMAEREAVEEEAARCRLTQQAHIDRLQREAQLLTEQARANELRAQQSDSRASEAEQASREAARQLQQYTAGTQQSSEAAQSELLRRVSGVLLPLLPGLACQTARRLADMEQRLVRLHTAVQLAAGRAQAKQRHVEQLAVQHSDDAVLLQRLSAALRLQAGQQQQRVQQLSAEHEAYCALLRAQVDEERARAERAERQLSDQRASSRAAEEGWERREAELRLDRSDLVAYYHAELDKLCAEIERLENDREEMDAATEQLRGQLAEASAAASPLQHAQPAAPAPARADEQSGDTATAGSGRLDEESAGEWQRRATAMSERMAAMAGEVRGMRDEICVSQQRESDWRRAVAALRRDADTRDSDKERQLDGMRALLTQLTQHVAAATSATAARQQRQKQHSEAGLLESSRVDASYSSELNDSACWGEAAALEEEKEQQAEAEAQPSGGGELGGGELQRLRGENAAMRSEVARERRKSAQLLRVRHFVQQHSSPSRTTLTQTERCTSPSPSRSD